MLILILKSLILLIFTTIITSIITFTKLERLKRKIIIKELYPSINR